MRARRPRRIRVRAAALIASAAGCAACGTLGSVSEAEGPQNENAEIEARADEWFGALSQARLDLDAGEYSSAEESLLAGVELSLDFPEDHPQQFATAETIDMFFSTYVSYEEIVAARRLADALVWATSTRGPPTRMLELDMLRMRGELELDSGQTEAALASFMQFRSKAQARFGNGHPASIRALSGLARVRAAQAQWGRALALSNRAIVDAEESLGRNHIETSTALFDHARVLTSLGNLPGSNEALEDALAIRREQNGGPSPDDLVILNHLAPQYLAVFDYERALATALDALDLTDLFFEDRHPAAVGNLALVSEISLRRGEVEVALEAVERSLELAVEIFGPESAVVARELVRMGVIEMEHARYAEAADLFQRAISIETALAGGPQPASGLMIRLAEAQAELGNRDVALETARVALEAVAESHGADSVPAAEHECVLARLAERNDEFRVGAAMSRTAIEVFDRRGRARDLFFVRCLALDARLAAAIRDDERVNESALRALKMGSRVFGVDSPRMGALIVEMKKLASVSIPSTRARDEMRVFVSEDFRLRFELPLEPWIRVRDKLLEPGVIVALVRQDPRMTFAISARTLPATVHGATNGSVDNAAPAPDTQWAVVQFEKALGREPDRVDVLASEAREVSGVAGVEYVYRAKHVDGKFLHVTWLGVHEGVLYELKLWSRVRRTPRPLVLERARELQDRLTVTGTD